MDAAQSLGYSAIAGDVEEDLFEMIHCCKGEEAEESWGRPSLLTEFGRTDYLRRTTVESYRTSGGSRGGSRGMAPFGARSTEVIILVDGPWSKLLHP